MWSVKEPYRLGIDIGASRVHAATARLSEAGAETVEPVPLGRWTIDVPALMSVSADGDLAFGDSAAAHLSERPEIVVRGIRHRVGTEAPFVVGEHTVSGEDAYARLAAAIVQTVAEAEDALPASVVLTHPMDWGAYRLDLVRAALAEHCPTEFDLIPEPVAAAWGSAHAAEPGQLVAVYDLGAVSLETAVLRRDADGWRVLTPTAHSVDTGGIDFDDAVVGHVGSSTTRSPSRSIQPELRVTSVDAKETLSSRTETTVAAQGVDGPVTVRLTRDEFESIIRGLLDQTVRTLHETINDGDVDVTDVSAVLLAGGSARIPSVAHRISAGLNLPVVGDPDPAAVIATGAARHGLIRAGLEAEGSAEAEVEDEPVRARRQREIAALMPFIHNADQARLATIAWRIFMTLLVLAAAAYLAWTLRSGTFGIFGIPDGITPTLGQSSGG